ncbi:MAG: MBL fold metallo-hydrolase [Lachnospiraceae bacterium]|nr:MBL fold metallo-hydrolase [Lachnospiraceae bacterium]
MDGIRIIRGSDQIGGVVTEFRKGDHRILIDFGANLPGTKAKISDEMLVDMVFSEEGKSVHTDAVLFTHYHGDHVGLKNHIPDGIPMYVGETAKEIMKIIAKPVDYLKQKQGRGNEIELPTIEKMEPYWPRGTAKDFGWIRVTPLMCDHSALDAYMFVLEMNGKRILYTGDFRAHGISGEITFEKMIKKYVGKIDILVTEGTMVTRMQEEKNNHIRTEEDLRREAKKVFEEHKENVVLVSSTNLDSIMEFYQATPRDKNFLCDLYQAKVMRVAMEARSEWFSQYRFKKRIYVLCPDENPFYLKELRDWKVKVQGDEVSVVDLADPEIYLKRGFVMLARPNRNPDFEKGRFEQRMEQMKDPFITYSMWEGYLEGGKAEDPDVVKFMQGHMDEAHVKKLHTSGHAYVEDLKKLMDLTKPDRIIPMHTEAGEAFAKLEIFKEYADKIDKKSDGEVYEV